ncbi:hypothetical protein SAMN05192558_107188 [Actinokineospora alba]|uniref:HTH luxR-type domain-containing protein n=1 Tax=Actinokineospora alba TaxID=504798 RepID=A0A1H0QX54_9PSEU|nr:hypothetical protein [Actinokineospora alba]TDP70353.1 hypothetical protein C8E96_5963 [Actinokineospora alba]SDI33483.1 hypothetical protein SAMN05421871_104187 [Actinokineospora alba]SDP21853.1 hypothetical protein SAMN05192558_107188 [Actinokineospora alba]
MNSVTALRPEITPLVGAHLIDVYRYAARRGAIESVEQAAVDLGLTVHEVNATVNHLIESRLLRVDPDRRLVPVDPEVAAALLVSPMEREIYQRRELIAQIRERTDVFRQDYVHTGLRGAGSASVESVSGVMEVRGLLKVASDACREEILVLLSGTVETDDFDDFMSVCDRLLSRGVAVRVVCRHKSRTDFATRVKIKKLIDAGAVVRTASHIPRAAVVFDRSSAVLLGDGAAEATASRVRQDEVVEFLLAMIDHLWDSATPLESFESGYAEVADELQQTVACLMAKGFTDEVVARKLGMSVRTCRRHIAALMSDLHAVSRFQAGVQAAQRCLVN